MSCAAIRNRALTRAGSDILRCGGYKKAEKLTDRMGPAFN